MMMMIFLEFQMPFSALLEQNKTKNKFQSDVVGLKYYMHNLYYYQHSDSMKYQPSHIVLPIH